jgi:hypothetical protein
MGAYSNVWPGVLFRCRDLDLHRGNAAARARPILHNRSQVAEARVGQHNPDQVAARCLRVYMFVRDQCPPESGRGVSAVGLIMYPVLSDSPDVRSEVTKPTLPTPPGSITRCLALRYPHALAGGRAGKKYVARCIELRVTASRLVHFRADILHHDSSSRGC